MFDKKMFIDTLKVSPEANLDTFGRVRKINEQTASFGSIASSAIRNSQQSNTRGGYQPKSIPPRVNPQALRRIAAGNPPIRGEPTGRGGKPTGMPNPDKHRFAVTKKPPPRAPGDAFWDNPSNSVSITKRIDKAHQDKQKRDFFRALAAGGDHTDGGGVYFPDADLRPGDPRWKNR